MTLTHAWRGLRHTPGFTAITIVTLALGLGGTTTMFAAVNAAFLRPLPYPGERELVKVYQARPERPEIAVSLKVAHEWSARSRAFEALAAYLSSATVNLSGGGDATRGRLTRTTLPFFTTIGVSPGRGRGFAVADAAVGAPPVAIVSHDVWRTLFGGREDVLAQTIRVDGAAVPIVGVMPAGFDFPDRTDIWTLVEPEGLDAYGDWTAHNFEVVARLQDGASVASAIDDLRLVDAGLKAEQAQLAEADLDVTVRPLRDDLLGEQASLAVLVGLGAVLCVLLISCVNVANLLLARSLSRETETGIRLALGAGAGAIIRLVVAEGLLLAAGGAALGWVFSLWGLSLVTQLTPASLTGGESLPLDLRVLGLALAATMAAGLLCSLLPAFRASRVDARQALVAGARTIVSTPRRTMHTLVAVEVALAFVLLFGAGLLARTYATLDRVDVGFRTDSLMLMQVSLGFLPDSTYARPEVRRAFFERLESSAEEIPGVRRVGLAVIPPGAFSPNGRFFVEGRSGEISGPHWRLVGGDYFATMGIPVRRGRAFADTDDASRRDVAVINQALADLVFPGEDPLGQHISMPGIDGGPANPAAIVGVVANVRHRGPTREPLPEAYFSYRQRPWRTFGMTLIVDADRPAADLRTALQAAVRELDSSVPPVFSTMAARAAIFLEPYRFRASLLAALSGLAFALSLVGIAGVVSYTVARRHHEIGVRIALGATPRRVVALVVRTGLWPVGAGALAGALGAMSLARLLDSFLFETTPRDPWTLAAVAGVLIVTAAAASWWPARRASRVNPIDALRP